MRRLRRALAVAGLLLAGAAGLPAPAAHAVALPLGTYIVTFADIPTAGQLDVLSGVATGVHGFEHLPAAVVVLPPSDLGILANLPGVQGVYPNSSMHKELHESVSTIRADQVWNTPSLGFTGDGIGVAVLDTGIDGTHPDVCAAAQFCNGTPVRTVQNVKFVGNQSAVDPVVAIEDQIDTDTTSGHGTHVSGIVGSAGTATTAHPTGYYRGVAFGSKLIGLGTGELLSVDNVLAAWDWVIGHKDDPRYNIKVVNNSYGPDVHTPYDPNDPVQRAIVKAHDAGISVVFSGGNAGPATDSMNAFSVNPDAISVASGQKNGHISVFSSRGVPGNTMWHPTVTAPGSNIVSDRASTGFAGDVEDVASGPNPNPVDPQDASRYATSNGTSMAAPHVAGVVALMQQASFVRRHVYLTPDQVKNILQNTAVSRDATRGPGGLPNYQQYSMGAGYVDALRAVEAAAAGTSMQAYNPHVKYDVRTFGGQVTPLQTATSTYTVGAGAISLDVMADWGQAANDLDIDLYDPANNLYRSTFLQCDPSAEFNGYSSFCTQVANERITVPSPAPGTWRAVVKTMAGVDTPKGTWSAAYTDTAITPPPPIVASVTVAPATATSATGQPVQLVATVRDAAGNPLPNKAISWTSAGTGFVTTAETTTHLDGTATAEATSWSPGTQTVTATSGGRFGTSTITWVGLVLPGPGNTPGKVSGGGWILDPAKEHFALHGQYRTGDAGPSGEVKFDDHAGTDARSTGISQFTAFGNQVSLRGPATVNGSAGYQFQVDVVDNGEPGRDDTFHLVLTSDTDPLYRYETQGTLAGGNIQVSSG